MKERDRIGWQGRSITYYSLTKPTTQQRILDRKSFNNFPATSPKPKAALETKEENLLRSS